MNEREAMHRAIDLAWGGWGAVHPNPLVGAVVLSRGQPVGEGFHRRYGDVHAEVAALDNAGEGARDGTMVVTLEPCNHHGQQPPCTEAILAAGLSRLVYAVDDPNPVALGGAGLLRASGVEVIPGLMAQQAALQNASFLGRHRNTERPWIALKLATSVDGRIADRDGRSSWISGEEARAWVHWLRAGFDAIAVGAGTVRADDPLLTVRGSLTPRVPPTRIVFTRSGVVPSGSRVLATAHEVPTWVVAVGSGTPEKVESDAGGVTVVPADSLDQALKVLRERGVGTILVEGGGLLAGALLARDLVDRFYWIQSPLWLGQQGRPAYGKLPSPSLGKASRWLVAERRALGQDTLLTMDRASCLPD